MAAAFGGSPISALGSARMARTTNLTGLAGTKRNLAEISTVSTSADVAYGNSC